MTFSALYDLLFKPLFQCAVLGAVTAIALRSPDLKDDLRLKWLGDQQDWRQKQPQGVFVRLDQHPK